MAQLHYTRARAHTHHTPPIVFGPLNNMPNGIEFHCIILWIRFSFFKAVSLEFWADGKMHKLKSNHWPDPSLMDVCCVMFVKRKGIFGCYLRLHHFLAKFLIASHNWKHDNKIVHTSGEWENGGWWNNANYNGPRRSELASLCALFFFSSFALRLSLCIQYSYVCSMSHISHITNKKKNIWIMHALWRII